MAKTCPCILTERELGYIGERNQQCCFNCRLIGTHSETCGKCCENREIQGPCRKCGATHKPA